MSNALNNPEHSREINALIAGDIADFAEGITGFRLEILDIEE